MDRIFDANDRHAMNLAVARFGSLRVHGDDLLAVLDGFWRIEEVCPGLTYRCHICGIPWGH